jgi:hypothetical protein
VIRAESCPVRPPRVRCRFVTVQGSREARRLPELPPFRPASCAAIPNESEPSSPSLQTFPGSNQAELRLIEATPQERHGTGIHLPPGTCRSRRCPRSSPVRPAIERRVRLFQTVHRHEIPHRASPMEAAYIGLRSAGRNRHRRASTASARTSRKQLSPLGKMRTTWVRRLISSFSRFSILVDLRCLWCCPGSLVKGQRLVDVLFDSAGEL